ncbi:MAG TPA: glutaredoxin family protein [Methanocellaceae archaeon]|jgi:glutaredoxin
MDVVHVDGKKNGNIMLYALSTCVWCKMTKKLLGDLGVDFSYVFVDLLQGADRDTALGEVKRWNPSGSFPTLVINDLSIVGFQEEKIREALK